MTDDVTAVSEDAVVAHIGDDAVTRALNLLGERWTMLIMRGAFYGIRRYGGFVAALQIPRPTLSDRLGKLVEAGLLIRTRYAGGPIRSDYEYRLTEAGIALFPAILVLMQWGDRYLADGRATPRWIHVDCEQPTSPELACDHCAKPVTARNVRLAGPPHEPVVSP